MVEARQHLFVFLFFCFGGGGYSQNWIKQHRIKQSPSIRGQFSKSRKLLPLMYFNFDLY